MVKLIKPYQLDSIFGDSITDLNASVLNETAVAPSLVTLFDATDADAATPAISVPASRAVGTVTFTHTADHQVAANITSNGAYSADWPARTDGTIKSLLSATDPNGASTSATGNAVSLDTDSGLNPTLSVNAA